MFSLTHLSDVVRISPEHFEAGEKGTAGPLCMPHHEALIHVLSTKYVGKVVQQCGLAITVKEVLHVDLSFIVPGDGASWTKVHFLLVVFRPLPGTILTGFITRQDIHGISISLGIHDDVIVTVPSQNLRRECVYESGRQSYVWLDTNLETGEKQELYFVKHAIVRCSVVEVLFRETEEGGDTSGSGLLLDSHRAAPRSRGEREGGGEGRTHRARWTMVLKCAMDKDGLGLEEWWV